MKIDRIYQKQRERAVLAVYIIYTIAMSISVPLFGWQSWIVPVIIGGLAFCIFIYVKQYKTYEFRAYVTTVMMWMNFSIYLAYSSRTSPLTGSFSTMAALIILIAIYCVPNLTYISTAVYTFHLLFHLIFVRDVLLNFHQEGIQNFIRIASVYVVQFVTYMLMKVQVQSNEVLLHNIETVKEAEQSKDDFMANMSHEIRTPINTVCGLSEMVLREDLSDDVREGVYSIQSAGRQLLSLVSDILDFSELSSGKMEIIEDTYNITSTVNDVLNMAVAKTDGKNVEIIVDCDADIPRGLVGDEQKIRRAIMNIMDNAIKFTEEGGILLKFSFRKESYGGNLLVTVQDTGVGMNEDMIETLFNRFSQFDTKRNRKVSGMGLGLSITKVIINRMGGFITVKSEYGKGTTVQMVFPQKVSDERPITGVEKPNEARTLLYLDVDKYHNSLVRDSYQMMIANAVHKLNVPYYHARSFAECKRRLEREDFDYLFVAWKEYCGDRAFFEELTNHMNVVLILERDHKESIEGSRLLCVYKPIYTMTISSVLNGQYADYVGRNAGRGIRFTAPDAKVLVVDDNIMNLKVVEGLLRPYKFKVFVAESGKEALEKIDSEHFDLVFMDHMMPEMDGIETFHRIKQKPGNYYRDIPVIALTANAIGGAREMFLQEGFADYVSKPIEMSALERTLAKFIPENKKIREYEGNAGAGENSLHNSNIQTSQTSYSTEKANAAMTQKAKELDIETETQEAPVSDAPIILEGVDTALGLHYCGDNLEDYVDIVRTYVNIGKTKKEDIKSCLQNNDIKNYTIHVHAVKSTSLGIGAVTLSEMAKALEAAGRSEDIEYINSHNAEMLDEYERVLKTASENEMIFPEGMSDDEPEDISALEDIDKALLLAKLDNISELLESFDQEPCIQGIEALYIYKFGDKSVKKIVEPVFRKLDDFDFMGAKDAIDSLKETF